MWVWNSVVGSKETNEQEGSSKDASADGGGSSHHRGRASNHSEDTASSAAETEVEDEVSFAIDDDMSADHGLDSSEDFECGPSRDQQPDSTAVEVALVEENDSSRVDSDQQNDGEDAASESHFTNKEESGDIAVSVTTESGGNAVVDELECSDEIPSSPDENQQVVDYDALGIDEDGEVIITEDFPLADGFLVDDDNMADALSVYEAIADKDENLVEAFRALESDTNNGDAATAKLDDTDPNHGSQIKKHRPSTRVVEREQSDENQALFDILDRDFASVTSRVSIGDTPLTSEELRLCFAAFVVCFTPPPKTHYAAQYNHSVDEELAQAKYEGTDNDSESEAASRNGSVNTARSIREITDLNPPGDSFPRPYVPVHIVNALWKEILSCRLSKAPNNLDDIPISVLSFVRDSLVLLGVLDIRKIAGGVQCLSSQSDRDGDESVLSLNDNTLGICTTDPLTKTEFVEVVTVHQNIHQEYGEYLMSERHSSGYRSFMESFGKRTHKAIARACSPDPGHFSDAGYAAQMLPWNMITGADYRSAANLLADKRFVHRRLQVLGVLDGVTAQVTDVEELLFHVYNDKDIAKSMTVSSSNAAMLEIYEQTKKVVCKQTKDLGPCTHPDATSKGLHAKQSRNMQLQTGQALHLLGVSLGAQGYSAEALLMYEEALRLKRAAEDTGGAPLAVTISDTMHCAGFAHDSAGRYLRAMECYNEALELRRSSLGDDDLRVAETLHNKGAILCETGSCDAAMTCLEEALQIRQFNLGEVHELCADTQQWIGNVLREWERYDDALSHFKTALQIKKATLGFDHEDVANTLQNMAIVLDDMSRYAASLGCYNEALRIYRLYNERESTPVADTMQFIANVYAVSEEHEKALNMFTEVVEIREAILNMETEPIDDRKCTVQALISSPECDIEEVSRRYGKLLSCYEEVLPLTKLLKGPNHTSLGNILHRMGDLYWKLQDWDNAVGSYQGALRNHRALSASGSVNDAEICQLLEKKGTAHLFREEYQRAKTCFESIVHRRKSLGDHNGFTDGFIMYCLGVTIHHLKTHQLSLLAFTEALRLWKQSIGEDHVFCGHVLYWIGAEETQLGHHDRALQGYRGALHNYKRNKQNLSYNVVVKTLECLGSTHELLGDVTLARKALNEAARLLRWHCGDDDGRLGIILCSIGRLCEIQGDSLPAIEAYKEAIAVLKQQDHEALSLCVTTERLGALQSDQGSYSEAKDTLSEAYRLYEGFVGQNDMRTANAVYRLGRVLDELSSYDAAMQCYRECLRVQKKKLGVGAEPVGRTLLSMGINWNQQRKSREAIECLQQALSIQRATYGDNAKEIVETLHNLGIAYTGSCAFDKAAVCFKEAVRITKELTPVDESALPEILFDMASAEDENGNFHFATASYNEALSIWRTTQPERVPKVLHRLGAAYEKKKDFQQAVHVLSEAHTLLEQADSPDDLLLIDVVGALARSHGALRQHDAAIEVYLEHVSLLKACSSDDEKLADSLYALGTIRTRSGDLEGAIADFDDCLSIRKACFGADDDRVARVLVNLSVVYEKLEDLSSADQRLGEALDVCKATGDDKEVAVLFQHRGRILSNIGNYGKAVKCFESALLIQRRLLGSNDPIVATLSYAQGLALLEDGKLEHAKDIVEDAWRIRKLKLGEDTVEAAEAQFLLGRICYESSQIHEATGHLLTALKTFKESGDYGCREVGDCSHFLGCAYAANEQHVSASEAFTEALPIRSRFYGSESLEVADTCHCLGTSLLQEGHFEKALEAAVQALRIRKMKVGNDSLGCAQTLRLLGTIQEAIRRTSEALNCYVEALRVFTVVQGKGHADVASTLVKIGSLYMKSGEQNKAIDNLKRALKIYKERPSEQSKEIASVLIDLGNVESSKDNVDAAIDYYKQSLHLSKHVEDQSGVAAALYKIGLALESRGDNGEAMECYQEVFRIVGDDDVTTAKTYNRVGSIEAELEDYDSALSSFQTALQLSKRFHGDGSVEVAQTVHNMAGVYEARSEFEKARSQYSEALCIYKSKLDRDDLVIASVLSDFGINCARRKEYAKALELSSEVLRIRRLRLGATHLDSCDAVYNIANILDEWGKIDQAMKFYTEALQLYRSALGHDDVEVANCFQYIGMLHLKKNEDDFAVRAFKEALRIYEAEDEENLGVATVQFSLGQIHLRRGEFDLALQSFSNCFRIRKKELGDCHVDVGTVCEQIGSAYVGKKMNKQGWTFYQKSLQILEETVGKDSVPYSNALAGMASLRSQEESGRDEALKDFRHCLEVFKREVGEESDEVADVLVKIGVIHNKRVDYEEAMKHLTSALKIRSTLFGRDDERVARTLFEIGCVLEEWGDSDEAIETYHEVLRIIKLNAGQKHEMIGKAHNRIGRVHMENGDHDAALRSFKSALEADRSLRGDDAVELGHTLINIGGVHDAKEEADAALASYSDALKIFRKTLGKEDPTVALALNNIGTNYARRRNYTKAIELCSEALRIRRASLGSEHLEVAESCLNIANILDEWGKDEQALKFYQEAMSLYRQRLGDEDAEVASCLQHIGSMHMKLNNQDKAIACFVESIRIFRLRGGDDNLDVALSLFNLGRIYGKRSEYEKSLACFKECLRIRKEVLGDQNLDVIAVHRYIDAIKRKMRR